MSKNKNNVIEKEQSLGLETQSDGVQTIAGEEVCNDEMDNDLNRIIGEKEDCIRK